MCGQCKSPTFPFGLKQLIRTYLVAINGVVMFDRVDLCHRKGHSEPHDGNGEGLHSALLEDFHIGSNG